MNKKAMDISMLIYLIKIGIFTGIIVITSMALVTMLQKTAIDTKVLESNIFMNHLIYSPHALGWYDAYAGRNIPGIVDVQNFNAARIESSYNYGKQNTNIAAQISLLDSQSRVVSNLSYNAQMLKRWIPVAGKSGSGSSTKISRTVYVLYAQGNKLNPGVLKADIYIPNS